MAHATLRVLVVALCVAAASPATAKPALDRAQVQAAFTPGDDIAGLIERRIGLARKSVRMQAYLFTDRRIANALLRALNKGVEVEVIGDAAQHESGGLPWLVALDRAGARIYLNTGHAASHNKIVIVDDATVITGSYNFTQAAQSKNAENVVVISGSPALARRFLENFELHRGQSIPWPRP